MNINDFIEQRLSDDEQTARAAGEGNRARWAFAGEYDRETNGEVYRPDTCRTTTYSNGRTSREYQYVTMDREGLSSSVEPADARHIARHDPARVLRQCTAARTILALAKSAMAAHEADYRDGTGDEGMYGYRMGESAAYHPVLKAIAAAWSDHSDYQPEWGIED